MKPEPLKETFCSKVSSKKENWCCFCLKIGYPDIKQYKNTKYCLCEGCYERFIILQASAVEWLKERLRTYGYTGQYDLISECINEAFEDVIEK